MHYTARFLDARAFMPLDCHITVSPTMDAGIACTFQELIVAAMHNKHSAQNYLIFTDPSGLTPTFRSRKIGVNPLYIPLWWFNLSKQKNRLTPEPSVSVEPLVLGRFWLIWKWCPWPDSNGHALRQTILNGPRQN